MGSEFEQFLKGHAKLLRETADEFSTCGNTNKDERAYLVGMANGLRLAAKLAERNLPDQAPVTERLSAAETVGRAESKNE